MFEGFTSPMDDAVLMCVVESIRDRRDDGTRFVWWKRASLGEQAQERHPFQVLHHEVAVADIVDGYDVGMG